MEEGRAPRGRAPLGCASAAGGAAAVPVNNTTEAARVEEGGGARVAETPSSNAHLETTHRAVRRSYSTVLLVRSTRTRSNHRSGKKSTLWNSTTLPPADMAGSISSRSLSSEASSSTKASNASSRPAWKPFSRICGRGVERGGGRQASGGGVWGRCALRSAIEKESGEGWLVRWRTPAVVASTMHRDHTRHAPARPRR